MSKQHDLTYSEAISWLFEQFPSYQVLGSKAYKPTLENTIKLLSILDNPQDELKFVHVAGSNGKGSTCSMIASALTEAGYKVGLFTSPHIEDYTERIRINGQPIEKQSVVDFVEQMRNANLDFDPSFFEMTFALALKHFISQYCDIVIIETGLGGRLDATNVITPLLSVITNISLEHTAILGDTLELIAEEKAGIIKQGIPIITAEKKPSVQAVFKAKAEEVESAYFDFDQDIQIPKDFPLLGKYQKDNFRLALSGLKQLETVGFSTSSDHVLQGLRKLNANTGFKARLQIWKQDPLTILDVSHNPDGIKNTLETIREINQGELHVVYGTSADKDISSILDQFPGNCKLYLTEFTNPRTAKIDQLKVAVQEKKHVSVDFFLETKSALKMAQNTAKQSDTILIIGSFFLVADFF
jgi:dihydrofolate synthase/folylpolyglutamate synthase